MWKIGPFTFQGSRLKDRIEKSRSPRKYKGRPSTATFELMRPEARKYWQDFYDRLDEAAEECRRRGLPVTREESEARRPKGSVKAESAKSEPQVGYHPITEYGIEHLIFLANDPYAVTKDEPSQVHPNSHRIAWELGSKMGFEGERLENFKMNFLREEAKRQQARIDWEKLSQLEERWNRMAQRSIRKGSWMGGERPYR
jgi:hypothetical protein